MREIRTSGSVGASRSNLRGDPTPPPQLRSILRKRQEAWDGEEGEGGAIRADSEGIRVRHRDGNGGRPQAVLPGDTRRCSRGGLYFLWSDGRGPTRSREGRSPSPARPSGYTRLVDPTGSVRLASRHQSCGAHR